MALRRKAVVPAVVAAAAALGLLGLRAALIAPDDWMPTLTDDPALIARGEALFEKLPQIADAKRDPYATACGIPATVYCTSSPTLTPEALVAATGAQLVAQGARLEHRTCPKPEPDALLNLCNEVYWFEGVQIGITASDEAVMNQKVPTFVFGYVLTSIEHTKEAMTPLGPWRDLGIVPASWGEPPCADQISEGCVRYQGSVGGSVTPEDARQLLRARLTAAGYRIDMDRCTKSNSGAIQCRVTDSRFLAQGGNEGRTVIAHLSPIDSTTQGFKGFVSVTADPRPPGPRA